jgi:hypothetical protein
VVKRNAVKLPTGSQVRSRKPVPISPRPAPFHSADDCSTSSGLTGGVTRPYADLRGFEENLSGRLRMPVIGTGRAAEAYGSHHQDQHGAMFQGRGSMRIA